MNTRSRFPLFSRLLTSATWLAVLAASLSARADVMLTVGIDRSGSLEEPGSGYGLLVTLNTTDTPITYDEVISPTAASYSGVGNGASNGASIVGGFSALLNELTNNWTLVVNAGDPSQKTYTFHGLLTNFTTNLFPDAQILFPSDGAVNVSSNLIVRFASPSNWIINTYVQGDNNYFDASTPSPNSTYWAVDQPLNNDTHFTSFIQYSTNDVPNVGFSTPVTGGAQMLPGWSDTTSFVLQDQTSFDLGVASTISDPGHVLVAYYTFDDPNNLGTDASGNGNNISSSAGFEGAPGFYWTNSSIAGGGAVQFVNGSWLIPPASLLSNLAGSYSISLWINTTNQYGNDTDQGYQGAGIISADAPGVANDAIPMALNGSTLGFFTGNPELTVHLGTNINSGQWTHLVVTRDQASGRKVIYVNGEIQGDGMGSTNLLTDSGEVDIGEDPGSAGIIGIVDDVQFYAGVLQPAEVATLYANPGSTVPELVFSNYVDLGFALNATNLVWSTRESPGWSGETGYAYDQVAAATSGSPPDDSQESTLETTLTGEGILSFWWSSEANPSGPFDFEFDVNGLYDYDISGINPWQQFTADFGPGTSTLDWFTDNFYGGTSSTNDAGFLDEFSFESVTSQPSNAVFYAGTTAAALASTYGNPAIQFNWQLNGNNINGQTNEDLIITNSSNTNAGPYRLLLNNDAGSFYSDTVNIAVTNDPALPADYRFFGYGIPSPGGSSIGQQVAVASNGDVYVAGNFTGTNKFGATTLASTNSSLFVGRLNPAGTWLWATNGGGTASSANIMEFDPSGQLVVAGSFQGTAHFGSFTLTNAGSYDSFLARYDTNGNCNLALRFGSSGGDFIQGLTFDPAGNIYVAGVAGDTVQAFGANASVAATNQPVIVSYTTNGTFRWELNGTGSDFAYGDGLRYMAGSLYLVGWKTGQLALGTNALTNNGQHSYLARVTTNGVCNYLTGMASTDTTQAMFNDFPQLCYGPANTLYIVGNFQGSNGVFGSITLTNPSGNNSYIARFDSNANFLMVHPIGNSATLADAFASDASGNLYAGGTFSGGADFGGRSLFNDRGPGFNPADAGNFAAKYTPAGVLVWARGTEAVTGGGSVLYNAGVAVDANGNVFEAAPMFGIDYAGTNILAQGSTNAVFTRISAQGSLPAVNLVNVTLNGTNLSFAFVSTSGHTNIVQATTNLISPAWSNYSNVIGDGSLKTIVVPAKTPPERVFRVDTQ